MWKDSETELDFLDYNYLIYSVKDIVMAENLLPACIGVYGDWGSGKSSLIRMCKRQLEAEDKGIKCLIFNGWLFESYEDAKTAILGEILDAIQENTKLTKKAKQILAGLYKSIDKFKLFRNSLKFGLDLFLTGGLGTLANLTISKALETGITKIPDENTKGVGQSIKDELDYKELREDIREFQRNFAKLLEESKIKRLVVFIDELDRCRPDTILDTLEAIKLFLFVGKAAFILGADERHIAYAVKSKFKDIEGQEIDIGKEYLEKLVQYPIKIPRLNSREVETYIGCLLLQEELDEKTFESLIADFNKALSDDFTKASLEKVAQERSVDTKDSLTVAHQLSYLLAQGLNGNPRQCKRFLNMMDLRIRQAKYKNKDLDRRILAKVMMLEYFRINLFKEMAAMMFDGNLKNELVILENSKSLDNKSKLDTLRLKDCLNDDWFMKWCSVDPKLGNQDLDLYFYFARTSLEERISLLTTNLSPVARELLNQLMSKSDITINKALSELDKMSVHDVMDIIEAMAEQLLSMGHIEDVHMKTFFDLVSSKKEYWEIGMKKLAKFSAEQISAQACAYIVEFAKNSKQTDRVLELCDKNWSSNSRHVGFIRNGLK